MPEQTPSTPDTLDTDAIIYHEIMSSCIRAGFTRKEAMEILKTHIAVHAFVKAGLPYQSGGTN